MKVPRLLCWYRGMVCVFEPPKNVLCGGGDDNFSVGTFVNDDEMLAEKARLCGKGHLPPFLSDPVGTFDQALGSHDVYYISGKHKQFKVEFCTTISRLGDAADDATAVQFFVNEDEGNAAIEIIPTESSPRCYDMISTDVR